MVFSIYASLAAIVLLSVGCQANVILIPPHVVPDQNETETLIVEEIKNYTALNNSNEGDIPRFENRYEEVLAEEGDDAELNCYAAGAVKYIWYNQNDDIISSNENISINSTPDNGTVLIITDVKDEHGGIYTCTASNSHGLSSKLFKVTVTPAPDPCSSNPCRNEGECEKIDRESFSCKCPNGYTGETCEKDPCSSGFCDEHELCLIINNVPHCEKDDINVGNLPTFENPYEKVLADEGSMVRLYCYATGEEEMEYTWYDQYEEVLTSGEKFSIITRPGNGSVLAIRIVRSHHGGIYTCTARNSRGLSSKLFEVTVKSGSNPCSPNPCRNGGECQNLTSGNFYCSCLPDFSGPTCEDTFIQDRFPLIIPVIAVSVVALAGIISFLLWCCLRRNPKTV